VAEARPHRWRSDWKVFRSPDGSEYIASTSQVSPTQWVCNIMACDSQADNPLKRKAESESNPPTPAPETSDTKGQVVSFPPPPEAPQPPGPTIDQDDDNDEGEGGDIESMEGSQQEPRTTPGPPRAKATPKVNVPERPKAKPEAPVAPELPHGSSSSSGN
jgi:hypothetical protein